MTYFFDVYDLKCAYKLRIKHANLGRNTTFNCIQNDNHRNNAKHTIPYYRNIMLAEKIFLISYRKIA